MKLIHCADIHLDSAMSAHLDYETAKRRRGEILRTFVKMVDYAAAQGINAILIAGDMFDTQSTRELTKNTVMNCIASNPAIAFFYIRGNHDDNNFIDNLDRVPNNLMLFGGSWSCYECGEIAIYGAELSDGADSDLYQTLKPDPQKINIVMLHGQTSQSAEDGKWTVSLNKLRGLGIDYLALGHIHSYTAGKLDGRGIWCYPGCLEGRGFDECGEHGFVLLDIDEKAHSVSSRFIPFAQRGIFSVTADLSGCLTTAEMTARAAEGLDRAGCADSSLVRLTLTGELDADCEKDIAYIESAFADRFYFFRTVDSTRLKIPDDDYRLDESLKGEFIRTVGRDGTLSDQDRAAVIRYGLLALAGEEAD